jgi:leucyl aminopeptidase (aminopeptidase T)
MGEVSSKELERAAMKLLKENIKLKKAERVVLVTDRKRDPIFDVLKKLIKKRGNKLFIIRLTDKRENSSPIPGVAKTFYKSDVIVAPTTKSISHSPETYTARHKYGVRVASMPGITPEMFVDAMKVDVLKVKNLVGWFYDKLKGSKVVNITTPSGTHIKMDVRKTVWHRDDYGDISKKEVLNNVPFGEVDGYPPIATGLMFVDYWGKAIKPEDRAWVYMQRGKIVKWNKSAEVLIKKLKTAGECGLKTVELGIGTNYAFKKPIGVILQDEKIYGTAHVAFGGHGTVQICPIHIDVILMKPTIWVDGRKIMEKGKLIK